MQALIIGLCIFIALEHFSFMYLEMVLWTKKAGRRIFANSVDEAEKTKVLAANQGLYNGFIAAGIIWGVMYPDPDISLQILLFFTVCVSVAGIYGGMTAKRSILYIQGLPGLIAVAIISQTLFQII